MTFEIRVFANCEDAFLAWEPGEDIPGCLGFAIERRLNGTACVLENRVGFGAHDTPEDNLPAASTDYPFQRLTWTDHGPGLGDRVAYRITARVGTPGHFTDGPDSGWSDEITLTATCGATEAYFNRGVVLSQFVARLLKKNQWTVSDIKTHAAEVHDSLREFLSGQLRLALLRMLDEVASDEGSELYAALFELSDPELVPALAALKSRLHIVLGNGAVDGKGEDENEKARATLIEAGAEVINRMSAPTFLAHNKFALITRKGTAESVWTGSTNWQPTGLCTQANNGIMIHDNGIACVYMAAWERLRDAGSGHPAAFKQANTINPPEDVTLSDGSCAYAQHTAVSTPKSGYQALDISELLDLIAGARQSLLFAMFMPGADIFNAAVARGKDLFVRGVANTFPKATGNDLKVSLVSAGQSQQFGLEAVQPEGIEHAFAYWAEEITRREFGAIGHAIIHSKVLVIDAWGKNPTIVTGSHNFSKSASTKNDENFIVISGNRALAQAYAVNCLGLYDHYRWRQYVAERAGSPDQIWSHLSTDPGWLAQYRKSKSRQALLKALGF